MNRQKAQRFFGLLGFLILFSVLRLSAQIETSFTQFFVNPYHFNPSYAGIEGRPTLFLYYRQQWAGIEGSPATANLSFHTPLKLGLNFGLDVFHDSRGVIGTNTGLITIGYVVPFSRITFLRFGISGGMGFRNFDLSDPTINTSDPALKNVLDKNSYITGNVGLSFQTGYFNLGVSLPSIFQPNLNSLKTFGSSYISPLDEILFNISYRFYFANDNMAFEPEVLYRSEKNQPDQYEAAGILHIKNLVWLGGSYRQDYGVSAFAGIKILNLLSFGYSYGIGSAKLPGIGNSTHELVLTLYTGKAKKAKRKDKKLYLSFIDAEKFIPPKPERKPVVVAKEEVNQEVPEPSAPVAGQKNNESSSQEKITEQKDTTHIKMAVNKPETLTSGKQPAVENIQPAETKLKPEEKAAAPVTLNSKKEIQKIPVKTIPQVREESALKGNSPSELETGSYIVIGSFNIKDNAARMAQSALNSGYPAAYGFVSARGHWYVYVKKGNSPGEVKTYLPLVREDTHIKDAWILTIYNSGDDSGKSHGNLLNRENQVPSDTSAGINENSNSVMEKIGKEQGIKFEKAVRGDNLFELLSGNYVVLGEFSKYDDAKKYSDNMHDLGQEVRWGFSSQKNLWYDYIYYNQDADAIRDQVAKIRKVTQLKNVWLLAVR